MEALTDAGIGKHPNYSERVGVYIGSGIGGLPLIEATHTLNTSVGPKKISPFFYTWVNY
jgi:3-oxoacyl-[acyl-carrier-protein] synthase II